MCRHCICKTFGMKRSALPNAVQRDRVGHEKSPLVKVIFFSFWSQDFCFLGDSWRVKLSPMQFSHIFDSIQIIHISD